MIIATPTVKTFTFFLLPLKSWVPTLKLKTVAAGLQGSVPGC